MEKVTWHSAISFAGQGIGKARVYRVFKAPLETGCQNFIDDLKYQIHNLINPSLVFPLLFEKFLYLISKKLL